MKTSSSTSWHSVLELKSAWISGSIEKTGEMLCWEEDFVKWSAFAIKKCFQHQNEWKRRVSIPVPRACEARALPIELRSRWREGSNSSYKFLLSVYRQQASFKSSPQSLLWLRMLPWYACISQAWAWPCGCLFTAGFRVSLAGYRVRVPPCWAGPPGPGGRCDGCRRTLASVYQCLGSCWSLILSGSHCLNYRRSLRAYQQTSL